MLNNRAKARVAYPVVLVLFIAAMVALTGCAQKEVIVETTAAPVETITISEPATLNKDELPTDYPVAIITMQTGEQIVLELYPDFAPNTVNNFISLAESGFYDGLIFHRVINGFMIQGGDPTGTGSGGPGYLIPGEFTLNGFENNLGHIPGVVSMARAQAYDSAGSQFFICHGDASFLDTQYAAFGMVIAGMDAVDRIARVATGAGDRPVTEEAMATVEIIRNDYTFDDVIKVND